MWLLVCYKCVISGYVYYRYVISGYKFVISGYKCVIRGY